MVLCEPHRKHILRRWFYSCMRLFRALPRNGSTCHNILQSVTYTERDADCQRRGALEEQRAGCVSTFIRAGLPPSQEHFKLYKKINCFRINLKRNVFKFLSVKAWGEEMKTKLLAIFMYVLTDANSLLSSNECTVFVSVSWFDRCSGEEWVL
jgi:hypothetical protein